MGFNGVSVTILVRGDYGTYYDFCTKQLGFVPVYGDKGGPYTNFARKTGEPPLFAIFVGKNVEMWQGYKQPDMSPSPDTICAVITTDDCRGDYKRMKYAGVQFLGEPQFMDAWGGIYCAYFRDPEGNLIGLFEGEI
ncbi:MAG: VOC family protein [Defluviitaleaceae bacterium]|nr:VOC family protein [Defluviitaleaceae bacterium]